VEVAVGCFGINLSIPLFSPYLFHLHRRYGSRDRRGAGQFLQHVGGGSSERVPAVMARNVALSVRGQVSLWSGDG
jgi:hypothetical protein